MSDPLAAAPRLFQNRPFRLFWASRFLINLAVAAESVTIGWQVYAVARQSYDVKQGAFLVGMVGLVQFAPLFLLTLTAGEVADRRDRKMVVMLCLAAEIVCVIGLAALALHPRPSLAPIFAIAALFGAARAFLIPASSAIGPMLVPKEMLPRAIAWNSLGFQAAAVTGPLVGGLLCAVNPSLSFTVSGGLYAVACLLLLGLGVDTKPPPPTAGSRIAAIKEGLAYVWTNKIVLGATSLDLFAVLLGGATALLPVFARDILQVGASGFGILRAAPAAGAAIVAAVLSRQPIHRHAGKWLFGGVAIFGVATLVFALSRSLWLSFAALAVLGAADMISVFIRTSLVQIVTPNPMRGRVSAVSNLFIGASNELGEFESGVAARLLGPIGAAIFGGIGSLVVTGAWAKMFPSLWRANDINDPES
ncbi:MAG: MFS transporter [Caulobacteraceae bacterium]